MTTSTITLEGSIGIAQAATLHSQIIDELESSESLAFDLSETRDLDASALQLLLAARQEKPDAGEFSLQGMSDDLASVLRDSGAGCLTEASDETEAEEKPGSSSESA